MTVPVTHDLFDLTGQRVLLTGATGGLGRAIAKAMAARGAQVLISDVDPDACEVLAAELSPPGTAMPADLSRQGEAQGLAELALRCGGVDVLVCNAGVQGPAGPLGDTTDADWEHVMDINLRSAVAISNTLAPDMAQRGGGSIVLMASIAGLRGNRSIGLYGLSKAALAQLARNLAVEWGPKGVRVNTISPGLIETPLARQPMADADFMRRRLAMTPLRRVGQPCEVAGAVVFLASAAGAFITGHNLVVDGGTLVSDGN